MSRPESGECLLDNQVANVEEEEEKHNGLDHKEIEEKMDTLGE